MSQRDLGPLIEPAVAASGCDLEDLRVSLAGRRRRIEVVIDRDGGVDLDLIAEVSRAVSEALDAADATGEAPYVLEVASPGVDRPLTEAKHWRRNVGRLVTACTADGGEITGRIVAVAGDDAGGEVVFDVDGVEHRLALDGIDHGRVHLEFRRAEEQ